MLFDSHIYWLLSVDQTVSFPNIILCVSQPVDMICVQITWNRIAWVNFIWFTLCSFCWYPTEEKISRSWFLLTPLAFRVWQYHIGILCGYCTICFVERISCGYVLPRECLFHFAEWFRLDADLLSQSDVVSEHLAFNSLKCGLCFVVSLVSIIDNMLCMVDIFVYQSGAITVAK